MWLTWIVTGVFLDDRIAVRVESDEDLKIWLPHGDHIVQVTLRVCDCGLQSVSRIVIESRGAIGTI